jgi:hypothetical protein
MFSFELVNAVQPDAVFAGAAAAKADRLGPLCRAMP